MYINGERKGLSWFIVPIRDPETGKSLPGITLGDVGAKFGRTATDNGWLRFNSVKIPRKNMLMRWTQVDADGKYTPALNQTLVYSALIGERIALVSIIGCFFTDLNYKVN